MTGRERRDEARRGSRAPGATRREAPWGPRAQERLLPTLNAVLMPGTTGLPPQLQRRTCSRNHFSSFLLRSPSNSPSSSWSLGRRTVLLSVLAADSRDTFLVSLSLAFPRSLPLSFVRFLRAPLHSSPYSRSLMGGIFHLSFAIFLSAALILPSLLGSSVFCSFLFFFTCICALPLIDIFLLIVALAADAHVVPLGHDLSLYRRDRPRQGRRSCVQGGQTLVLPSLDGISHGFGLRTAVDLIAGTRRRYSSLRDPILDFRCFGREECYRVGDQHDRK